MGKVYITGIGIQSKLGNTLTDFWHGINQDWIQEKQSLTIHHHKKEILADMTSHTMYEENYEEYFLNMCYEAIVSAIHNAKISLTNQEGCIILGTGMGMSDECLKGVNVADAFMSQLACKIQKRLQTKLKVIIIANACCAGAQSIAYAYDLLRVHGYDFIIAGGIEAFSYITYCGFKRLNAIDNTGCKPFDTNRKGIYVGDGAVFYVLRNTNIDGSYCKILGQAVTSDAYHIVAPKPDGSHIYRAISQALHKAKKQQHDIDVIVAHGTGTRLNDRIEGHVIYELFGNIDVTAPKGKIGHTGGASGAFGLLTALCALEFQCIPYIVNLNEQDKTIKFKGRMYKKKHKTINNVLVNCFAFGGTNTVLVCGL